MFGRARSPSPASNNYDFTLRHERVKLFAKVLKQFDANISRTMQAMQDMAGSLSLVGQSYHEVAQCVNNTNPHSAMNRAFTISNMNSNRVVENYGAELQSAATMFAGELKGLREGEPYAAFSGNVHQTVLVRLREVMARAKKTCELGDEVYSTLRKFAAAKKIVLNKEAKYVRLGKPLTESKRYARQAEAARQREQNYAARLRAFDTEYEGLMQRQLYVAGHTMDDFLDLNTVYVAQVLKVLSCLAPHGADAVENMMRGSQELSERLGIAPENQVARRLKSRDINENMATPMWSSPDKATSHRGPSHNFTSYYCYRKNRDVSADQAPPTARALDDSEQKSPAAAAVMQTSTMTTNLWTSPCTPRGQPLSFHSPQGRSVGLSYQDPTSPPPAPCPNPMARLSGGPHTFVTTVSTAGANSAMPVVPRSGGAVIQKSSKGIAAASTKSTTASAQANCRPPSPPEATAASTTGNAQTNGDRAVTLSPGRAPFGDDNQSSTFVVQNGDQRFHASPFAAAPATALKEARSPSGVVSETAPTNSENSNLGSNNRRAAVLHAQAARLGLDRARSTEPFDDDGTKGVASYTARPTLQPVNLMSAMEAAAGRPSEVQRKSQGPYQRRDVNTLTLKQSSTTHQNHRPSQALQQRQSRKARRTTKALGTHCAVAEQHPPSRATTAPTQTTPMMASAPPPDDTTTRSSSTNSHFFGDSNAHSFRKESLSFIYKQQNNNNISNNTTSSFNHGNPFRLTTPATLKSYSIGDGWETETGGATERSHALSTSNALGSPAYAPHVRGMEAQNWEAAHVRACSPA